MEFGTYAFCFPEKQKILDNNPVFLEVICTLLFTILSLISLKPHLFTLSDLFWQIMPTEVTNAIIQLVRKFHLFQLDFGSYHINISQKDEGQKPSEKIKK